MKKTGMMLAVMLAAVMGFAQEKTAVVNMIDLVRYHPSRERDRKLMEDMEKDCQGKLDKNRERVEELAKGWEAAAKDARNPALSDKARAEAEDKAMKQRVVAEEAQRDLRQQYEKFQRDLSEQDTRLLRQVTDDIRDVVTKYAKESKISIVMDGSTLAYFDPKLDATDDVLKKMGVDPKVRKEAASDGVGTTK